MRIKIQNISPEDQRVKLIKTPTSVAVLGEQSGAVGENAESIFMCLSPEDLSEFFNLYGFQFEDRDAILALNGSVTGNVLFKRLPGEAFTAEPIELDPVYYSHIDNPSLATGESGQTLIVYGASNGLDQVPIAFYTMSGGKYEPFTNGSRLINDVKEILTVSMAYYDMVCHIVYFDKDDQRRHCFFINEDAAYNQRPSAPCNFLDSFLSTDGTQMLTSLWMQLPEPKLFDVNSGTGTVGEPYEVIDPNPIIQMQLINRALFDEAGEKILMSRYNSLETWTINKVNASLTKHQMLNSQMVAEIGNYPIETKYTITNGVRISHDRMLLIVTDKDWKSTICSFEIDVNTNTLIGTLAGGVAKGLPLTDVYGMHSLTWGETTQNAYYSTGKGIMALNITPDNIVTEVIRS